MRVVAPVKAPVVQPVMESLWNEDKQKAQTEFIKALRAEIGENYRELRELEEKSTSLALALEAAEQKHSSETFLLSNIIETMKMKMNMLYRQLESPKVCPKWRKNQLKKNWKAERS